jgi:hypothetical protein
MISLTHTYACNSCGDLIDVIGELRPKTCPHCLQVNSMKGNIFFDRLAMEIQNLDEIGGPDTPQEYVAILEALQIDIARRIDTAKTLIREEK